MYSTYTQNSNNYIIIQNITHKCNIIIIKIYNNIKNNVHKLQFKTRVGEN